MGKEKYLKDVERLFKNSPVVSFSSIEKIVNSKKNIKQYTKQLVRNLILQGKIKRLTKGYYTIHDESSLLVFCFKTSYLGLQDALSFHNLWEQETIPVIVTSRKVRQGIRNFEGANVLIRRIDRKYILGFDYFKSGEFFLPYSDIEKTFIDMVYFKERLGEVPSLVKKLDKKKIDFYLRGYPKVVRERVLFYLR